jgi:D-alanyl-D-alanine carboxypeptidase (penicillin-binding protein 5/6)
MIRKKGRRDCFKIHTGIVRLFVLLFFVFSVVSGSIQLAAAEENWPSIDNVEADSFIVIDSNTGNIILEKNSDERIHPASLTKILTAIVALESFSMENQITVSKAAASLSASESTIDLIQGEVLTFKELLYGMMLSSGNDAAMTLADGSAGGAAAFLAKMNAKSKEIGALNSAWNNPQGITADAHYSTSYDLALITRYALQNDTFSMVVSTGTYSMAPTNKHPYSGWNVLENTNKLLRLQDEYFESDLIYSVSGVKTGTTTAAGSNLITTAHLKNGLEVICVLNGVRGDNSKNVWSYTRAILEEAGKVTDGVQTILFENKAAAAANDSTSWVPSETCALFIGDNPKIDITIKKESSQFLIQTADGKTLFQTKVVPASDSNSVSSDSSAITSGGTSSNDTAVTGNTNRNQVWIIILLGVIAVLGILLVVAKTGRSKKQNRTKRY